MGNKPFSFPRIHLLRLKEARDFLLSDNLKVLKISLAICAFFALCIFSLVQGQKQSLIYEDCILKPARCTGQKVEMTVRRVLSVKRRYFILSGSQGPILVLGNATGLQLGDVVDVTAIFYPVEPLQMESMHIHRHGRWIKVYISLLPVILVAVLLWRSSKCR